MFARKTRHKIVAIEIRNHPRKNWGTYLARETIAQPRKELAQSAPKGALQKCVTLEFYERFARMMQNPARKNS